MLKKAFLEHDPGGMNEYWQDYNFIRMCLYC
ncbi:Hypothetical protein, conserved [Brucella abortus str. 2308 A]|uniref:Uncharacterized protein n=5 Tax=Brucella TaxID=234 RepID=Q2YJZ6_BRUA2|nr:hypothetical protein BRA0319 [Brucella suis 1330]AAX76253.1 hypothetical protein BruAb2_0862 [Brucella abortus bv. 1 str. 9-941]ABX63507.1 Hypothetical protein, conserved [Brucella canis ATCC 23365]ACU49449.1 hypothetical protein BMI_II313 [Brucella microti CCM 4915]AEK55765.1 hypothetical protein BPI_II316 [Brucella pinnipedialis B2/94]AEU07468.1 hypothetical protein BSVBI22_B0315 [Brucella suis VBI22]AHN48067.1 hypothetical protein BSS2_II0304 [Brucella suis bv. 1 str. S2]EEP62331.1 Hyp